MKDAALIKQFLHNMSRRAAQMVLDDLNRSWRGRNPDTAIDADAHNGRTAIEVIMALVRRLVDEGWMAEGFNRDDSSNFLTESEVDALLEGVSQDAQ
jgi:flagellar motor switch protein FliG